MHEAQQHGWCAAHVSYFSFRCDAAQLVFLVAATSDEPVGWVEPTGRANARPMINSAIPITWCGYNECGGQWVSQGLYPSCEMSPYSCHCGVAPRIRLVFEAVVYDLF